MNKLKGYKVYIWASVYHGDEFSHTTERVETIHAYSVDGAKSQVTLRPKYKYWRSVVSEETIKRVDYLGVVNYDVKISYIKDDE